MNNPTSILSTFAEMIIGGSIIFFCYKKFYEFLFSKRRGKLFCIGDLLYIKTERKFVIVKSENKLLNQVVVEYPSHMVMSVSFSNLLGRSFNLSKKNGIFTKVPSQFELNQETLDFLEKRGFQNIMNKYLKKSGA